VGRLSELMQKCKLQHEWVYMQPNNFSLKNLGISEVLEDSGYYVQNDKAVVNLLALGFHLTHHHIS